MEMTQDGVRIMILPDGAKCEADEEKRSPLELQKCPLVNEECQGNCYWYSE